MTATAPWSAEAAQKGSSASVGPLALVGRNTAITPMTSSPQERGKWTPACQSKSCSVAPTLPAGDGHTPAADDASNEVDRSLVVHVDTEDRGDTGQHPQLNRHQDGSVRDRDRRGADTGRRDAGRADDRPSLIRLQTNHYTLGVHKRPSHRLRKNVVGPLHELLQSPGRKGLSGEPALACEGADRRARDGQAPPPMRMFA
jgi:hypothetical protein